MTPRQAARPLIPLPICVLTGFLGAGKTTLLNRLLREPALADTAVIINEFGAIGLDHLLLEQVDDGIVALSTGCLCCTLRGDLIEALERLLRNLDNGRAAFSRVIIETSGLADPVPVLHTLMMHPYLVLRYRLDGIVTVVDAVNGAATLDAHAEAVKQVAVADRLVLSKTDIAADPAADLAADLAADPAGRLRGDLADDPVRGRAALAELRARLRNLNPSAPILDAAAGEAVAERLVGCGLYDPARKIPDVTRWLAAEAYTDGPAYPHRHAHDHANDRADGPVDDRAHERAHAHGGSQDRTHVHGRNRHDDHIRAFCLTTPAPVPAAALEMFLDLVRSLHGPNLLRLKGVVKLAEEPDRPAVIHAVQHLMHPVARLEGWPDDDHNTRMVFIVRDIEPPIIDTLFNAFMGAAAPDRPDRAAVVDNPLVPFGGIDR
jgi:G3E family GTPase